MLHYLGLVLILISWAAAALFFRWRNEDLLTISKHAARSWKSRLLFSLLLIGGGLPAYYWLASWFRPHLALGTGFDMALAVTFAAQFITALVPDTTRYNRLVHRIAAYSMATMFIPVAIFILEAPKLSLIAQLLGTVLLAYMVITLTVVAIAGRAKRHYLIYQILYIVAMQLLILIAAYT